MFRIKLLLAAAVTALAAGSIAGTATAAPSCTIDVSGHATSVNCVGVLTGLPPNVSTPVQMTLAYNCVNAFHSDPMTSTASATVMTDAHGNLSFDLTAAAAPCPVGLAPVPQSATITADGVSIVIPLP
jgi:type 1 fimbria pilin